MTSPRCGNLRNDAGRGQTGQTTRGGGERDRGRGAKSPRSSAKMACIAMQFTGPPHAGDADLHAVMRGRNEEDELELGPAEEDERGRNKDDHHSSSSPAAPGGVTEEDEPRRSKDDRQSSSSSAAPGGAAGGASATAAGRGGRTRDLQNASSDESESAMATASSLSKQRSNVQDGRDGTMAKLQLPCARWQAIS